MPKLPQYPRPLHGNCPKGASRSGPDQPAGRRTARPGVVIAAGDAWVRTRRVPALRQPGSYGALAATLRRLALNREIASPMAR